MSEFVKMFGSRVKFYRYKKKLSQEKLAELSGLHPTYIGQVERGEKNCTIESAYKIAHGLDVPVEKLFCDPLRKYSRDTESSTAVSAEYAEYAELFFKQPQTVQKKILEIIKIILQISENK